MKFNEDKLNGIKAERIQAAPQRLTIIKEFAKSDRFNTGRPYDSLKTITLISVW